MVQGTRMLPLRREDVQRTAAGLFAEHGFRGTSMRDIAAAVGVTAPNLYNHVTSKQQVLFDIMDVAMDRAIGALAVALDGVEDTGDQLQRATESLVLDFLRHRDEVTVCNAEIRTLDAPLREAIIAKRDAYSRTFRAIIDRGCTEGRFGTDEPRLAAFAILEMGNSAKAWFDGRGELADVEVARRYGHFARRIVEEREAVR